MASNYSSNPDNGASIRDSALPQNDMEGTVSNVQTPPQNSGGPSAVIPSTPSFASAPSGKRSNNLQRLEPGIVLSGGRYRIDSAVAEGGMGAVYRAIDTRFNRPCAVKEMLDNFRNQAERAQSIEWFSREATLLLDLNHQCIPRVRDFFAEDDKHYLVMDLIDGRTLADMMDVEGTVKGINGASGITEARARSWTQQLCSVLSYLHRQTPPVIFRDLKPSNIMVTNRDEIKLIDFGIARTFQTQQQATVIMTLGYAPPEQLQGMPEPRSDLFALGSTIHKLLTRHDPSNNKPNMFVFPTLRSLRPDITPGFDQIIMRALAPNLEQRWSSADEMDRALHTLPPVTAAPPLVVPGSFPGGGMPGSSTPSMPGFGSGPNGGSISGSAPITTGTSGPAGVHINAARRFLAENRVEEAYSAVTMAHGLEANNSLVHKLFGQIYARRRPAQVDTAIKAYNRSLQLFADDAETHKLFGDIWLYQRPNLALAIQAYTQSLRLNQNDFEAHEHLGECYDKLNRPEPALHEYQEAVRLAANQPELVRLRLYSTLGQIAMRSHQWAAAEQAFVQVLILDAANHGVRFLLSQVYEQEGKLDEAFRECGYVMGGPLATSNPAVSQMFYRLKNRLGR